MASAAPTVPTHVPPDYVVDFNLFDDPRFDRDTHSGLAELAAEERDLFWTPRNGGSWMIVGQKAVFDAARDIELFSSDPVYSAHTVREELMIPITFDPPLHTKYREIIMRAFNPRSIADMEPAIRSLTDELIDKVLVGGDACDFVPMVSEPLPVLIFMKLMGFPRDLLVPFRELVLQVMSEPSVAGRERLYQKVFEHVDPLIRACMESPQDDLMGRFQSATIDGRHPDFKEMRAFCLMMFAAGLDTVTNGMGFAMRHLALDQALQARLRADPALIRVAIEEVLRRYTFSCPARYVTRDADFYGAPLRKGDAVTLLLPAADLDPRSFNKPTEVDVDRKPAHIAFNAGPHRCIGANLARLELRILYEHWLKRVPQFRLGDAPWRYKPGFVFAVESLPLRWDQAA